MSLVSFLCTETRATVCIPKRSQARSVHHTAESSNQNFSKSSTVCIPLQSQALQCAFHRGVKLQCTSHHGVRVLSVHHTAESSNQNFSKSSTVCIPLQSQALQCASHHGVKLRSVHPTAESRSSVCIKQRSQTAHRRVKI